VRIPLGADVEAEDNGYGTMEKFMAYTSDPANAPPVQKPRAPLRNWANKDKIDTMVFEGGGVKGIAYVGVVKAVTQCGLMKGVTRVCGSSAGSGCALMVALGCSAEEIEDFSGRVNFKEFLDDKWGVFRDSKRVVKEYGIYAGAKLRHFYASVAKEKVGDGEITFKKLKEKTGMDLTITGTNVSRNKIAYFNATNTPDMPCADAVRISSSIEFFFAAVEYEEDIYVDGGVLNNFAVDYYDTVDAHGRRTPNPNVLGILLTSAQELKDWKENEDGGVHVATMLPSAQNGLEVILLW
jgi:NTE family protein